MTNRNVILVDLDDTVAASWRREHLIEDSWDAFHSDLINDEPVFDIVRLLACLAWKRGDEEDLEVIALTARPEKWRTATMEWFVKRNVHFDGLLMRPADDFRPSPIIKVAVAAAFFGGEDQIKERVAFIIDDRPDVIQAFVGLGVTALQIHARRG